MYNSCLAQRAKQLFCMCLAHFKGLIRFILRLRFILRFNVFQCFQGFDTKSHCSRLFSRHILRAQFLKYFLKMGLFLGLFDTDSRCSSDTGPKKGHALCRGHAHIAQAHISLRIYLKYFHVFHLFHLKIAGP